MKDGKNTIKTEDVVVGTTIVDKQGFESLTFSVDVEDGTSIGLIAGDDDALSDGVAVESEFIIGKELFATADSSPVTVGYIGDKRYVKLSYLAASGPVDGAAISIKGHPHLAPVDQS